MKKKKPKQKSAEKNPVQKDSLLEAPAAPYLIIAAAALLFHLPLLVGKYWMWEDAVSLHYANMSYIIGQIKQGIFPWWNPYSFGGMPFAADIEVCLFYPFHWLMILPQVIFGTSFVLYAWYLVLHLVWMGIGQYKLIDAFGFDRKAAILGALILVLSGHITGRMIHMIIILTAAWMPWALLFFRQALMKKNWKPAFLSAICLGFSMLGGFPQYAVHFFYFLGIYGIFHIVTEKEYKNGTIWKSAAIMTVVFSAAACISSVIYLQTIELTPYTPRHVMTYEEAIKDSLLPQNLFTLIIPRLFGYITGLERTPYWNPGGTWMYWEAQIYIGVLSLLLLAAGIWKWKSKTKYLFTGIILFALLASMGRNLPVFKVLFYLIPAMNKFRTPARFLVYTVFCGSILTAAGYHHFVRQEADEKIKKILLGIAGFFLVLWGLFAAGFFKGLSRGFEMEPLYKTAVLDCGLQFLLAGGLAGLFLLFRKNLKADLFFILLVLLLGTDLYRAHGSFNLSETPAEQFFAENNLVEFFHKQNSRELYRANTRIGRNMVLQKNQGMVHGIYTLQGYNPLRPVGIIGVETQVPRERGLDLFNVKYDISVDPRTRQMGIVERTGYKPRFWFADAFEVISDTAEIFPRLSQPDFPHKSRVILEETIPGFSPAPYDSSTDRIEVVSYSSTEIRLKISASAQKLLIAAESYYPAWHAEIDGKEQKIYVANRNFWAVPVPAGTHEVVFYFSSSKFKIGFLVSICTLIALIAGTVFLQRKEKK